ncbi:MAG: hypothetical protein ACRYF2_06090 [Janthinobacterium lividum]
MAVEPGGDADERRGIVLHGLRQASVSALRDHRAGGGALEGILRVTVEGSDGPDVAGRCHVLETGLRLVPHFPFQPGLVYRATFDPATVRGCRPEDALELVFSLDLPDLPPATVVEHVFPFGDCLPDNLLRFYVCFSNPMQRGNAQGEITVLGPDGRPAADVLYRPPAELWDPAMRVLTLLLDPGRLKRGVGPNRELGPPLEPGQAYMLVVGGGMTDLFGRRLGAPMIKRFEVGPAAREPVAIDAWTIVPPTPGGWEPLVIMFPAALDWAMLFNAVTVATSAGEPIPGRVIVDEMETRWSFTPSLPWAARAYQIRVDSDLEDPCGNTPLAAFDRPFRTAIPSCRGSGVHPIPFIVARNPAPNGRSALMLAPEPTVRSQSANRWT